MQSKNLHVGQGEEAAQKGGSRARWALLPALSWAAVIFVLSSFPGSAYPQVGVWSADKFAHVAVYGALGLATAVALHRGVGLRSLTALFVWSVLLCTAYGVSDEIHQSFVPGRSPDVRDVVADFAGAVLGAGVYVARLRARVSRT